MDIFLLHMKCLSVCIIKKKRCIRSLQKEKEREKKKKKDTRAGIFGDGVLLRPGPNLEHSDQFQPERKKTDYYGMKKIVTCA